MPEKTIKYRMLTGKIELLPDAFVYKGTTYPYLSVTHLGRFARRTYVNFIPCIDFLRIRIYVERKSKPITLQNSIGLFGTTSRLRKVYERLVEKTFQQRVKNYLDQIESKGYFEYGEAMFFPSGDVIISNHRVNLRTAKLWLKPFKLLLKESNVLFGRKRKISTAVDQEVFITLLKEIYGITFS